MMNMLPSFGYTQGYLGKYDIQINLEECQECSGDIDSMSSDGSVFYF